METIKYVLPAALALIAFVCPAKARADSYVDVAINTSVTGTSTACGGSTCVNTLTGSFEWDNTTQSLVSGTVTDSITGPINYGTLTITGLTPLTGPLEYLGAEFMAAGGDYATLGIIFTSPSLTPGTYAYATGTPSAGTFQIVSAACVTTACNADFPDGSKFSGTVTVTSATVPEPGTVSLLLATLSVLGFAAVRRGARSLA